MFQISFFISTFTFGGGYTVIPVMEKYFVNELKLIKKNELNDMVAISQSSPGAIAVNLGVLVGYRIDGIGGAITICIGSILPPIIILSVISYFYNEFISNKYISSILKGMEVGIVSIIISLLIDMYSIVSKKQNFLYKVLILFGFIANYFLKINIVFIIFISLSLALLQFYLKEEI